MRSTFSSNQNVQQIFSKNEGRIYRIRSQVLPHLSGFVYLIIRPDFPTTLIDAGSGEGSSPVDIWEGFETVRREFEPSFEPRQIKRVILTHTHIDHFGGVHELQRATGAEVWVHLFESRIVCSYNERATVSNLFFRQYLLNAGVEPSDVEPILDAFGFRPGRTPATSVDRVLTGGEKIDSLQFLHLPGHSCGHLAILFDDVLFSGDLILSKTLTQIWPERLIPHTGLGRYLDSVDKLEKIANDFEKNFQKKLIALPGHEDIIEDISRRVETIRKSVARRNQRIIDVLNRSEEGLNLNELAKKMYLTSHASRTFFAVCDVGSRVEFLQRNGKIAVANYDQLDRTSRPVCLFRGV